MKVLVVIPSFYPAFIYGGPIFTSYYCCEELADYNVEVKVATTNANMTDRLDIKPNIWHQNKNNFFIKYYNETLINKVSFPLLFNLWKDIKKADVINIQGLFNTPIPAALLYAKIFRKPVLLTPHGTLGRWGLQNRVYYKRLWLDWLIKPFAFEIIWHATSEQEKKEILLVFPSANVHVIPNGIKMSLFHKINSLEAIYYNKNRHNDLTVGKNIISIGRLHKVKGYNILIDSFSIMLGKYPGSRLYIAGPDGGEQKNLQKQINTLGLSECIFFIGTISGQDKINFLAHADLFVLPSHHENFGIVYAESLAAGTPIVASTNTPWQEVEEAGCGKWVPNTIDDTAKAMHEMLEKDRELIREKCKALAKKHDWKKIALQFIRLFERMYHE